MTLRGITSQGESNEFKLNQLTLKMDVLRSGKEAAAASVNATRNKNTLVKIPVGFMIKSSLKYNEIEIKVS